MAGNYRGYRGKKAGGCLIPLLIVLCVAAAAISLFLHRNLVYTPEGTQVRIPFSDKTVDVEKNEPLEEDVDLIIEEPVEPEPPKVEEITYEERIENSVFVPLDTVLDPTAFDAFLGGIKAEGINTVVLEAKAEDGRLAFASEAALAKDAGANAASSDALKGALAKVAEKGLNAAVQLSCFKDDLAPRTLRSSGVPLNNGRIFIDNDEITWLDAFDSDAKAYIKSLADELYALGAKEIIFTNLAFPYDGGLLSAIVYDRDDKQGAIRDFAAELRAVADEKGGKAGAVFIGNGGQALEDFTRSFYRIYSAADAASDEVFGESVTRLVTRVELSDGQDPAEAKEKIAQAQARGYGCMYVHLQGVYPEEVLGK